MISQILTTLLKSIGIGYLCHVAQAWLGTSYFNSFLQNNLVNILIALLAVNSATMGIVLTKVRDLIDRHGGAEAFKQTREHMLLSIKEQISLIILAVSALSAAEAKIVAETTELKAFIFISLGTIFAYAMFNLYDVSKSVLIIIDHE